MIYSLQKRYQKFQCALVLLILGILLVPGTTGAIQSNTSESAVLTGLVYNEDESIYQKAPPTATFTVFLNRDQDSVLIENAPRWDGGEENLEGNGAFRVQLGNFLHLSSGDSVQMRFTDNSGSQQAIYSTLVDTLPWKSGELSTKIYLKSNNFPQRPQNVSVSINDSNERTVTWDTKTGLSYIVYRRIIQDTLSDGRARNLYVRASNELSTGTFTDPNTSDTVNFAYIVYAKNEEGLMSSHSDEVLQLQQVSGITTSTTATNAELTWNDYQPAVGQLGGYQIYRRTEGGSYGKPIAYTGKDNVYRDTRLNPGTSYYYKVEARDERQNLFGASSEVQATTESSTNGYYQYANIKMAAVIYKNINGNEISDQKVQDIKRQYELAREFYWRNSNMKLNTEVDYYEIESRQNFEEPDVGNVAQQLKQRGVYNTQYDLVFAAWPIESGYWSIGTGANLNLPGPDRNTGFAQTQFPCGTGVVWPGEPDTDYCFTWIFVHENQHTIDDMYNRNGYPSMAHGDVPQIFNEPAGMHLDFQARMFRVFDDYLGLNSNWGDIMEVEDADEDGMPDNDPRVPLDEERFGSDPQSADTDGDGLGDRAEALDGIYNGSDPNKLHSDSDSLADGQDPYPRYNVQTYIKKLPDSISINVDGDISDWEGLDTRVSTGVSYVRDGSSYNPVVDMVWTEDHLFIGMKLEDIGIPQFRFEFEGDGRWHGAGNTRMSVNISDGTFDEFRTWDSRPEVREFSDGDPDDEHPGGGMWDNNPDYQSEFRRYIFTRESVDLGVNLNFPKVQIEMAIPRNTTAGLNLTAGDSLGWNINYGKVNDVPDNLGTTFDQYRFVYFDLIDQHATNLDNKPEIVRTFNLSKNYPNPFNPSTQIHYSIPQSQHLSLKVYDILGREVATLVDGVKDAGQHQVTFDASGLSSGVYLYRLQTKSKSKTRKMILMK